jgi:flagellar motor protein MotB
MSAERSDDSLPLMNGAVAMVMLVPLLLLAVAAGETDPVAAVERHRPAVVVAPAASRTSEPGSDQPPIITISEAQVYSFPSGAATVAPEFRRLLQDTLAPRLHQIAIQYRCNVIEVIGHTDGQHVRGRSNLDATVLDDRAAQEAVRAGSNPDLGLMRAWAVIQVLRESHLLEGKTFYGYSAGQTVLPDGRLAAADETPDAARRRIEIRVRRAN